ncbi:hypothetical protein [Streptococcus gallolyticus]|uniref:hypothetical protein n=1 Tax=Streptococcus gallolyticus TaxID=315405 RepID=UPI003D30158D
MNNPGIVALSGFAFQIKGFIYYLSQLKDNESVNYEILEDVSVTPSNISDIDTMIHVYNVRAIQVKKSNLTKDSMGKILKNWLILEYTESVSEYCLFLDGTMPCELFDQSVIDKVFKDIENGSEKRNDSLDNQLHQKINSKVEFEQQIRQLERKYKLEQKNIDDKLINAYSDIFSRVYSETLFENRLLELHSRIASKILEKADIRKSFSMNYIEFMGLIESIRENFKSDLSIPDYVSFKNIITIPDRLKETRQFQQLKECSFSDDKIERQLIFYLYFDNFRLNNLENCSYNSIEGILETTFENFQDVKEVLIDEDNDTPKMRLIKTQEKPNSYAVNEQIKKGSSIYLTKSDAGKRQISWKDD